MPLACREGEVGSSGGQRTGQTLSRADCGRRHLDPGPAPPCMVSSPSDSAAPAGGLGTVPHWDLVLWPAEVNRRGRSDRPPVWSPGLGGSAFLHRCRGRRPLQACPCQGRSRGTWCRTELSPVSWPRGTEVLGVLGGTWPHVADVGEQA